MLRGSDCNGGAEAYERVAAVGQDLPAERDAEVSVMRSLQSELRRSACLHTVSAPLAVHSAVIHIFAWPALMMCQQSALITLVKLGCLRTKSQLVLHSCVILTMCYCHKTAVRVGLQNTSHPSLYSGVTFQTQGMQLPHAGSMPWSACASVM